jgi:hypothetical protein
MMHWFCFLRRFAKERGISFLIDFVWNRQKQFKEKLDDIFYELSSSIYHSSFNLSKAINTFRHLQHFVATQLQLKQCETAAFQDYTLSMFKKITRIFFSNMMFIGTDDKEEKELINDLPKTTNRGEVEISNLQDRQQEARTRFEHLKETKDELSEDMQKLFQAIQRKDQESFNKLFSEHANELYQIKHDLRYVRDYIDDTKDNQLDNFFKPVEDELLKWTRVLTHPMVTAQIVTETREGTT